MAGFNHIVFIIWHDIEPDSYEVIGNRIANEVAHYGVEVSYAFQEITDNPGVVPEGRTKPWGNWICYSSL